MEKLNFIESPIKFEALEELGVLPGTYVDEILNSDILVLPRIGEQRTKDKIFSEDSMGYFNELKNFTTDVKVEICADDEDFKELSLHSDCVSLPMLLVTMFGFPIAVQFTWYYIQKKLLTPTKLDDVTVDASIVLDEDGKARRLDFHGKAEDFEQIVTQVKRLEDE